jgi:hypothetical protein
VDSGHLIFECRFHHRARLRIANLEDEGGGLLQALKERYLVDRESGESVFAIRDQLNR